MSEMTIWQITKKTIIMPKLQDKNDAIEINMKSWLNGTICEKMSLMTSMTSLRSLRQNNEEMKSLWSDEIQETIH